jgi:hypothetical protein
MAKKFSSKDFDEVAKIAAELKLKYWRIENSYGQLLKKCSVANTTKQLEEIWQYINSDFLEEGEYYIVGKTGQQSKGETKLRIEKGNRENKTSSAGTSIVNYNLPANYEQVVKENAELRANAYYLEELIKQKDEKIRELIEELEEEPENKFNWQDLVKEYTPQAFEVLNRLIIKPAPLPNFADSAPPPAPKLVRFTPEYFAFLKANTSNTNLITQELNYVQTNNPSKFDEWQAGIFS